VGTVAASDADSSQTLSYAITAGNGSGVFTINATSGEITIADGSQLDYETTTQYILTVQVTDSVATTRSDTATITINVNDVNEAPTISLSNITATLAEDTETTAAIKVADITITDDALGTNNLSLTGADAGMFTIVGSELFLNAGVSLDFETNASLNVIVQVDDPVMPATPENSASMIISIMNINEAPVLGAIGNQVVDETATLIFTATATDSDIPADTLTFSLDPASLAAGMTITAGGDFSWTPTEIQGGTAPSVTLTVTDSGTGNLIDSETFTITVNDINTAPVLDPIGNQTIDELTTLSFTATATDTDLPINSLTFTLDAASIAKGMTIDANSGAFSWTQGETDDGIHSVTITVTDDGTVPLSSSETFTISVVDINLKLGAVYDLNPAPNSVSEDAATGTAVGITAHAIDPDGTDTVTYSLSNDSGGLFTIDTNTGVISVAGNLDYENAASHTITIRANSTDGSFSELNFILQIADTYEGGSDESSDTAPAVDEETTSTIDPEETVTVVPSVEEEVQLLEVVSGEPGDSPGIPLAVFQTDSPDSTENSDVKKQKEDTVSSANPENITQDSDIAYQDGILLSPEDPNYVQLTSQEKASTNSVRQVPKEANGDALFKVLRIATQENMDFIAPSVSAMPIYQESPDLDGIVKKNDTMRTQIVAMHQDIDAAFEKAEEAHKIVVYMASGVSASFAVGAASYLLRAGSLMSSFLATVPIWKGFDPVAILVAPKRKKKKDPKNLPKDVNQPDINTDQRVENMFDKKVTQ